MVVAARELSVVAAQAVIGRVMVGGAVRPSPLETRRLLGAGSLRGFFAFVDCINILKQKVAYPYRVLALSQLDGIKDVLFKFVYVTLAVCARGCRTRV